MKKILPAFILPIFFSLLILNPAQAALVNSDKMDEFNKNVNTVASSSDYNIETRLENIISTVVRIALSVLGIIFLVLMFAAGNTWMQAAGNEEKIKKSQKTIQNLLIGLCIVLIAYALSSGFSKILADVLITK